MAGRPANADPWLLFPGWLRDQIPVPPGEETPKARRLEFLAALQMPPAVWVGLRGQEGGGAGRSLPTRSGANSEKPGSSPGSIAG